MSLYAVWATDREGAQPERQRVREAHRARLRAPAPHAVQVLLAGPLFEATGSTMAGTLLVVEAESIAEVRRFVDADPYVQAGVYASIDIRPWHCGLNQMMKALTP
jgi:uncharacterized protein